MNIFRLRLHSSILAGVLASASWSAQSMPLYKCVGADGIPQYVQKKTSGSSCSTVKPAPPPPSRPFVPTISSPAVPSPTKQNEFTTPPTAPMPTPVPALLPPGMPPRTLPPLPSDFKSG